MGNLAQQVTYLKTENKILRGKLPDRIQLKNQERRRLVKHGLTLGARIKDLISVASHSTFRKWVRAMEDRPENRLANKSGKKGRPRVDENIAVFTSMGARIKKTTEPRIGRPICKHSLSGLCKHPKHEIPNAFRIVNEQQLEHILAKGADWYNNRLI